jgi:hypothetical protein
MKKLWIRFREFRWSRPFWGGLFVMAGGAIIGWLPLGPVTDIISAGVGGIGGYVCSLILILMGLCLWFRPELRYGAAIITVIVALLSFPVSNLGGFVVGMMAAIIGGCLAFGWSLPAENDPDDNEEQLTAPTGSGSFTERV